MKRKQAALFSILLCVAILFSSVPGTGLLSAATATPRTPASSSTPDYLSSNPETPQITTYTQDSTLERDYEEITELNVPDVVGYGAAVEKGHIARVRSEEKDLYSVVFSNGDGTNTLYMFSDPVKFIDKDGKVRDKSNKIVPADGSSNYAYINGDNDIRVAFPALLNDGVKLAYNDIDIIMKPKTQIESMASLEASGVKTVESEELVRYDNVFGENTYLTYKPEYMGFKEDIVVTEYTAQSEFEFTLYTGGLELYRDTTDSEGGSLYLRNSKGEIVASLGQVIIFTADNGNNSFGAYEFETVKANEEYTVTIKVDPGYLKDPKTVYPIAIDPTITINYTNNGSGAIEDVTLNSTTGSDGSSTVLTVGKSSTYGTRRILMRFPGLNLNGIYREQITSANVYIRDLMCQTTGLDVYCHAFQGILNWSESSANWSNVSPNSYNSSYLSYKTIKYDGTVSYGFSILSAVKNWASKVNGAGYNGLDDIKRGIIFKLSSSIENGSLIDAKTFGSYNNGTTNYKPYLVVNYNTINPTISLNVTSITLTVGQTYQLTATTNPAGMPVGWHPYDPSIASVSTTGLVTGVSVGTSKVFAYLMNYVSVDTYCIVNVINPVTDILLTHNGGHFESGELVSGSTIQLGYTIYPSNASNKNVIWESSNSSIASVSQNGLVTAKSSGDVTITVKSSENPNIRDTCTIKVSNKYQSANSEEQTIWFAPNPADDIFIPIGFRYMIKTTVIYEKHINSIKIVEFRYFIYNLFNNIPSTYLDSSVGYAVFESNFGNTLSLNGAISNSNWWWDANKPIPFKIIQIFPDVDFQATTNLEVKIYNYFICYQSFYPISDEQENIYNFIP